MGKTGRAGRTSSSHSGCIQASHNQAIRSQHDLDKNFMLMREIIDLFD